MLECAAVCRLCLRRAERARRIFQPGSPVAANLTACCALQMYENDGLPDQICEECLGTLDLVINFRNQCEESDRILREGLQDYKTVKYEEPLVKVEYSPDHINEEFLNFGSDVDDIKPDEDAYDPEKKTKKILKKSITIKTKRKKKCSEDATEPLKRERKKILTEGEYTGLCPFCGKVFVKLASLNVHLRLHTMEKTHTCVKCSKSFRELRMLKDHEKTHLNIKNFPCEVCGKLFASRSAAKKHIEAVHRKSKVVFCNICNKKLASTRSLKGHMKTHTGEKEFECDICEQSFAFKCSLVVHLRCHTGEKPYSCKYCDARFAALKTIKEHERLHTGETPYICPVCSKGFSQKSNMKSHFRNNHKGIELI